MANKITKFILNGFQRSSFTKGMYQRMSSMFGHIAEYDIQGFYTTWFADDTACLRWAENVVRGGVLGFVVGDPAWTWSDVEKAVQKWIAENHIVEQIKNCAKKECFSLTVEVEQESQLSLFQQTLKR
jgi:hypothetical protein